MHMTRMKTMGSSTTKAKLTGSRSRAVAAAPGSAAAAEGGGGPGVKKTRPNQSIVETNRKTEICWNWERGFCGFGARCAYSHGVVELKYRTLRQMEQAGRIPDASKYRTYPCMTHVATGSCPYGRRCVFIHDPRVEGSGEACPRPSLSRGGMNAAAAICVPGDRSFFFPDVARDIDSTELPTHLARYDLEARTDGASDVSYSTVRGLWYSFVSALGHAKGGRTTFSDLEDGGSPPPRYASAWALTSRAAGGPGATNGGKGRRVGGRPPGGAAVPREPERRDSILSAVDVTVSGEARRGLCGDVAKAKQHLPVFESLSSGGGAVWCSTATHGSSIASTSDASSEETARDVTDSTTSSSSWEAYYSCPSPLPAAPVPTAEEDDDDNTTTTTTGLRATEDADSSSAFSYFSPRSSPYSSSSSCDTTSFSYFSSGISSPSCASDSSSSSSYFSAAEFSTSSDVDDGGGGGGPGGRHGVTPPVLATPVASSAAERRAGCQTSVDAGSHRNGYSEGNGYSHVNQYGHDHSNGYALGSRKRDFNAYRDGCDYNRGYGYDVGYSNGNGGDNGSGNSNGIVYGTNTAHTHTHAHTHAHAHAHTNANAHAHGNSNGPCHGDVHVNANKAVAITNPDVNVDAIAYGYGYGYGENLQLDEQKPLDQCLFARSADLPSSAPSGTTLGIASSCPGRHAHGTAFLQQREAEVIACPTATAVPTTHCPRFTIATATAARLQQEEADEQPIFGAMSGADKVPPPSTRRATSDTGDHGDGDQGGWSFFTRAKDDATDGIRDSRYSIMHHWYGTKPAAAPRPVT